MKYSNTQSENTNQDHLHGAAIIDAQGKETPITEEMIQKALERIIKSATS